jgi:aerobic-type carbon monoxide dehydrogenase small subunit (CoxS/CutS family)
MPKSYCRLMKKTINVTINGRLYEEDVEPRLLLSHFLRENIGLTGTHIGCVVGECEAERNVVPAGMGASTVTISASPPALPKVRV